jgi:hypothetical protein
MHHHGASDGDGDTADDGYHRKRRKPGVEGWT